MKEKIKEFAEKAGFVLWEENEYWNPGDIIDWSTRYDKELEEYTKLIVKECADIASINAHQYETPGTYVLKHFGIE